MNTPHSPIAARRPRPVSKPFAAVRGMSLVELLVSLAVAAVLMGLAAPSVASMLSSAELTSTSNAFLSSLRLARSEAAKRGGRVALCKASDDSGCTTTGGWEQGWIIFHDVNNNGRLDEGETVIQRVDPLSARLQFAGNHNVASYLSYVGSGGTRMVSGAFQAGTLTLCHPGAPGEARQIVMSSTGRARVERVSGAACT